MYCTSWINWVHPPVGWHTLDTDGSDNNVQRIAVGGVLRENSSRCVSGFAANMGDCTVVQADLWALIHGLRLAWSMDIRCLVEETDSRLVYTKLTETMASSNKHANLIHECLQLIQRN